MNRKQITEYLSRIGFCGEISRDRQCIEELMQKHLLTIPFENLEVYDEHRVPSLDVQDLFEKIITRRRGGYCFELNKLFYELLKGLEFEVIPVAVRILWKKDCFPPLLHRGTIVRLGEEDFFCDVGYGGPGPKGLLPLKDGEYDIAGGRFRVTMHPADTEESLVERSTGDGYAPMFQFRVQRTEEADFLLMNFYCAKSSDVLFTQKRIVNLCTENGSTALTDQELTIRHGMDVERMEGCSDKVINEWLKTYFGIEK